MNRLQVFRIRIREAAKEAAKKNLNMLQEFVRPFVVRGLDCNEEFWCGSCGKPSLRRLLYCSTECHAAAEERQRYMDEFWRERARTEAAKGKP